MNRKTHLILCTADDTVPPLIAIFTLPEAVEEEDVHTVFSKALAGWKPELDCPPERYAADRVCAELDTSVEFVEASQIYEVPNVYTARTTRRAYLIAEYHGKETTIVETACYADKEAAIKEWRSSYATVNPDWDEIVEVRPDEYYRARSKLKPFEACEMTVIEKEILWGDADV